MSGIIGNDGGSTAVHDSAENTPERSLRHNIKSCAEQRDVLNCKASIASKNLDFSIIEKTKIDFSVQVYAFKVRASGLPVAVKLLAKQGITIEQYQDIWQEVKCLVLLDHRNIMPILDVHEDEAFIYIISPLAKGKHLCIQQLIKIFHKTLKDYFLSQKSLVLLLTFKVSL